MDYKAMNAITMIDAYKLDHRRQYPEGTEYVYSNFTPRGSRIEGVDKVVFFGLQAFLDELSEAFQHFFDADVDEICAAYEENTTEIVGPNEIGSDHIRALHGLGYLPLEFKALPEGTEVPLKVPMFTVENTVPEFFWLVNYLESALSAAIWLPSTSATQARHMRNLLNDWAVKTTGSTDGVDFQGHDFSFRGMASMEAASASGAGHLLSFLGSDSLVSKNWIKQHYSPASNPLLLSVAATEHSVMCAGGNESERETYERLINLYPTGIVSIVSDTWDLWNVITNILPSLKDEIMARDGKLVVRPDSGNPVDILCGTGKVTTFQDVPAHDYNAGETPEEKGVIELLWEVFGGTVNDQGYKVLDDHIGAIYGDSINYQRAEEICRRLSDKGFASTNIVFGVGSYTYQYVTRDTFGFAMKATAVTINGEERAIFKDPVTDKGEKKSATGRMVVRQVTKVAVGARIVKESDDNTNDRPVFSKELEMKDGLTKEEANSAESNLLKTVFKDGEITRTSFDDIKTRLNK